MCNKEDLFKLLQGLSSTSSELILHSFLKTGLLDENDYKNAMEKLTRQEILQNHKAKVAQHRDGRWRTYVPTLSGKPKLKVRTTREKLEDDIVEAYMVLREAQEQGITFEKCYWRWREVHDLTISDNTIAKYDSDYVRFFKGEAFCQRPIAEITEEDVEKFVFQKIMELHLCREAMKAFLNYIKGTFASARKNKDISENVTKEIPRSMFYSKCVETDRPMDAMLISDEDWSRLYERLKKDLEENPCYFPPYAILLSVLTGMRVGELSVLKWSDIHTDPVSGYSYIGICRSETFNVKTKQYNLRDVKNHHNRLYPISPQIRELLQRIQSVQRSFGLESEWIFYHEEHEHVNKRQISDCLKNRCREIGIRPRGTHAFRRQLNSDMRCAGVPDVITSSLIGNSKAVNAKHYTFDVSGLEEKERFVAQANERRLAVGSNLSYPPKSNPKNSKVLKFRGPCTPF